jgi:hypothetical protein
MKRMFLNRANHEKMGEAARKLPVFLRVGGKEFLFLGRFRVRSDFAAGAVVTADLEADQANVHGER